MAKKEKTREDRAKNMKTLKVKVVVEQMGSFKKGDTITMAESTAKACEKAGSVEIVKKAAAKK